MSKSVENLNTIRAEIVEHELVNGLKVLTKEVHAAPVISSYIWYKVGARNERPGITGVSHWVEHMLFKGTPKFPKNQLNRAIEGNGGRWNAFTSTDYTAYYETLPADKVSIALALESDRMQNSIFDPEEVEAERTVILSEREGYENTPQFVLREEVQAAAYKAHPYQWGIIGWPSDLKAMTRDDLYDYYRRCYVPNNATLVLVGDFDTAELMKQVDAHFGPLPPGEPIGDPSTVEPEQRGERRVTVRKEGNIAYVEIAYHIPAGGHPDLYPLEVLGTVMSSGKTSRFYRALIDKQLATSASFYPDFSKDAGIAVAFAEAQAGVEPSTLEKALLEQIERLQNDRITEAELKKAINQTEAHFIFSLDSVSNQAAQLGYYETIRSYKYLETYLDEVQSVTREQIREAVQKYLTEDNRTVGHFQPIQPGNGGASSDGSAEGAEPALHYMRQPRFFFRSEEAGSGSGMDSQSPTTRHVFDNGLALLIQENHFNETVAISGRLKAGGMYDSPERHGSSDFVANMLTKGTESRTWEEIAETVESVGADLNAWGNTETVGIEGRLLSKDFDRVLDVLNDILRYPNFPQEEIEKHRHQVYSWLKAWEDDTDYVADQMLRELVYPQEHPYHWRMQGTEESLVQIQREGLVDFHAHYYRPDSLILVIVGDVDTQAVIEKVHAQMGDWTANGEKPPFTVPPVEYREKQIGIQSMMDKSQVNIELGHKGIARTHPDCYTFNLMNQLLGGSAGIARLFGHVRDVQGLAYSVWSTFTPSIGEGLFHASAGVNPGNVDRAIDSILHEIEQMKSEGITEAELADAQNLVVGNFALTLETNKGIASVLLLAELYGLGLDYPERHESIYRSITREQVNAVAQKYLHPDKCCIAIAGPYEKT
ncbi:MAG: pitrilysin family protein [Candidatus Poribacteria bacterium]|nr:pitrilysin family protein [Candidatus Poribacteria bacterium]